MPLPGGSLPEDGIAQRTSGETDPKRPEGQSAALRPSLQSGILPPPGKGLKSGHGLGSNPPRPNCQMGRAFLTSEAFIEERRPLILF